MKKPNAYDVLVGEIFTTVDLHVISQSLLLSSCLNVTYSLTRDGDVKQHYELGGPSTVVGSGSVEFFGLAEPALVPGRRELVPLQPPCRAYSLFAWVGGCL